MAEQYARYDAVIVLRTPAMDPATYQRERQANNQSRFEAEAARMMQLDARVAAAWAGHPRLREIPAHQDPATKVAKGLAAFRELLGVGPAE